MAKKQLAALGALLIALPGPVMSGAFGSSYATGAALLVILTLGQLANALAGSCGVVLLMSGHVRPLVAISVTTSIISVIAGVYCGEAFGAVGVATAFSAGLIVQNVAMGAVTRYLTGLKTYFQPRAAWSGFRRSTPAAAPI
jgi:O-antigen/teichoic acid export membrane protein